jgi:signal transduction histidine kinase
MITGHGDMDLAIKSVKFEATDFVTKPIHDEILGIALKRAQERIAMRQKLNEYTQNLEQLVSEKTKKLVEAERLAAIGQTVTGLAHAIKNIGGSLKGGAFVLEKGIELSNQEYLMQGWEMIKGNVDKITNLALDLLNYAKGTEIKFQLTDPNQPAREVVQLMLPLAQEQGLDLGVELSRDLKDVYLDPELIHRCLLNLVTNAIDACKSENSPSKSKKVQVRTQKKRGWAVEYQVVDNGSGMTKAVKEKIFQRFFSTKGSAGTGIGLMISKKIIDGHKGVIEVESDVKIGSKIIIRIPRKIEE